MLMLMLMPMSMLMLILMLMPMLILILMLVLMLMPMSMLILMLMQGTKGWVVVSGDITIYGRYLVSCGVMRQKASPDLPLSIIISGMLCKRNITARTHRTNNNPPLHLLTQVSTLLLIWIWPNH